MLFGDTLIKGLKLEYQREAVASFQFLTKLGQQTNTQRNLLIPVWFFKGSFFIFLINIFFNFQIAGPKDMKEDDIQNETFKAKLKSFEQDLMEEYNIEETRERAQTYKY